MTELALFSVAKEALAEARRTDEVKTIRDEAVRMRLYGEQAKDRTIIADASEIISRAERKLGELIKSAKEVGQLGIGRPGRSNVGDDDDHGEDNNGRGPRPFDRVTLQEAGISKDLSSRSQKMASLGETAFEAAMAKARDKILSGGASVVNPLKDVSTAGKKAARAEREQQLGKKQMALPEAKFGVIYADPEWKFQAYSDESGMDRSADNHYPTSSLETIKSRDVGSLAATDCVLFLWATVPMLLEALEVMTAWGFAYKSQSIWNKDRIGNGYWFRNKHEILLVGTRGKVPAPAMGDQFPSVIDAPVGEHSAKPEKFYEIIEAYYPTLPKIELNARVAREGWVRWGYEAPENNSVDAQQQASSQTAPGGFPVITGDDDDYQNHSGRPRGLAGPGDAEKGRAELSQVGRDRDGRAEHDARFLHPFGATDHRHRRAAASYLAETGLKAAAGGEPSPPSAPLSTLEADAIIRAGDADRTPLAELAAMVGRPGNINYVKNRRRVMKLSNMDRVRESVAASNRRRAAP